MEIEKTKRLVKSRRLSRLVKYTRKGIYENILPEIHKLWSLIDPDQFQQQLDLVNRLVIIQDWDIIDMMEQSLKYVSNKVSPPMTVFREKDEFHNYKNWKNEVAENIRVLKEQPRTYHKIKNYDSYNDDEESSDEENEIAQIIEATMDAANYLLHEE